MSSLYTNTTSNAQYFTNSLVNDSIIQQLSLDKNILIGIGSNNSQLTISTDKIIVKNMLDIGNNASIAKSLTITSNLNVGDTITTSNMFVQGDLYVEGTRTIVDTEVKLTEQFTVSNTGFDTAVIIKQTGSNNILEVYSDDIQTFLIGLSGKVEINSDLMVNGSGNFNNLKINNVDAADISTAQSLENKTLTANTVFPETIVDTISAQILENKTLSSNVIFPETIVDTTSLQTLENKTLSSNVIFPETIIDTTSAQTLENKTLSVSTVLPAFIVDTTSSQTLENKILSSNVIFPETLVDTTSAQTLENKTLSSNVIFPETLVDTTTAQTLENKTLSSNVIFPETLVDTTSAQTLENKTLSSNVIFPETLVDTTTAQTLENKTLSSNVVFPAQIGINTLPSIYNLEINGSTYTSNLSIGLISSSIVPDSNISYDLGTEQSRWRDLYLNNSTIYLGQQTISSDSDNIVFDSIVSSNISAGIGYKTKEGSSNTTGSNVFNVNWKENRAELFIDNVAVASLINNSDYRLNQEIVSQSNIEFLALGKLSNLNPVTYKFVDHGIFTSNDIINHGFIAHEIQDIIPDAVSGVKDEVDDNGDEIYQTINPLPVVSVVTQALKELYSLVVELKLENEELKTRVDYLYNSNAV